MAEKRVNQRADGPRPAWKLDLRSWDWRKPGLALVPVALGLAIMGAGAGWRFLTALVALLPLAALLGEATDHLARRAGPGVGGLLNATFGNAAELIIALSLLFRGLDTAVKASLTGSILGNLLLVLGGACWRAGGNTPSCGSTAPRPASVRR